jgi:hypothetical protein
VRASLFLPFQLQRLVLDAASERLETTNEQGLEALGDGSLRSVPYGNRLLTSIETAIVQLSAGAGCRASCAAQIIRPMLRGNLPYSSAISAHWFALGRSNDHVLCHCSPSSVARRHGVWPQAGKRAEIRRLNSYGTIAAVLF